MDTWFVYVVSQKYHEYILIQPQENRSFTINRVIQYGTENKPNSINSFYVSLGLDQFSIEKNNDCWYIFIYSGSLMNQSMHIFFSFINYGNIHLQRVLKPNGIWGG